MKPIPVTRWAAEAARLMEADPSLNMDEAAYAIVLKNTGITTQTPVEELWEWTLRLALIQFPPTSIQLQCAKSGQEAYAILAITLAVNLVVAQMRLDPALVIVDDRRRRARGEVVPDAAADPSRRRRYSPGR